MQIEDFEKLVKKAIRLEVDSRAAEKIQSGCLSDAELQAICEGNLSEIERDRALKHLYECNQCRIDLKFFFDCIEDSKQENSLSIKLYFNGDLIDKPSTKWISQDHILEIWNIKTPGKYILTIGSRSVEFQCDREEIIKQPSEEVSMKVAASEDKIVFSKEIISDDSSIVLRIIPGKHAGRFEVTLKK